ncbi:MAG: DUF1572 domain-containing protein [Chitinophagaceae bacterium]|nr:DUF1572 domain-containing protein [Chitinophagaceae bacterium]
MYIGKIINNTKWKSLSIPKGNSKSFNELMKEKHSTKPTN